MAFRVAPILVSFLLFFQPSFAQTCWLDSVIHKTSYDSVELLNCVGTCKQIPDPFKMTTWVALMGYPSLENTRIIIKRKKVNATAVARPTFFSIFKKPENRTYHIILNNKPNKKGLIIEYFDFNARVGLLAHELGHIKDYSKKTTWQLIADGLRYGNKEFRKDFENATDQRALEHGYGWQVHSFKKKALDISKKKRLFSKYFWKQKNIYMSCSEIECLEPKCPDIDEELQNDDM